MPNQYKSASALGLPTGDAVMRKGKVTVIPAGQPAGVGLRLPEVGPAQLPQMPQNAGSQVVLKTTYADRATGFLIGSVPMWLAFIVAAALIAYFFRDVPLFSVSMVGWMFTGAILSWVVSWLVHTMISPDGTTIIQSLLAYRVVRREQDYRHERDRGHYE